MESKPLKDEGCASISFFDDVTIASLQWPGACSANGGAYPT